MSLQISLSSTTDSIVGTARVSISDPANEVEKVEFFTTVLPAGARTGPFAPTQSPDVGVHELDVLLDTVNQTKVEAVATLTDSTTRTPTPAFVTFTARAASPPPPSLGSLAVAAEWWRIDVAVVPGSAHSWKCWVRPASWPTVDDTATGALKDEYLRFEGNRDELAFSIPIVPPNGQPWYVIAVGYDRAGVAGPRSTGVINAAYGSPVRPVVNPFVLQLNTVERKQTNVAEKLKEFTDWLDAHQQLGFISEVGWPEEAVTEWNQVASSWFTKANERQLWVTCWATGELWGNYPLLPYKLENGAYVKKPQSSVLELPANLSNANFKRGVNVAGAEFGAPSTAPRASSFSNQNRGVHGSQYKWNGLTTYSDGRNTYQYMSAQGHLLARTPFRWERIQPTLGAALDSAELSLMESSVGAAQAAGMEIILDVHNYGAYYLHDAVTGEGVRYSIGTPQVTFAHFADLWSRLAQVFNGYPGVIGYGLMNEPVEMTGVNGMSASDTWAAAAQQAANAIRAVSPPPGAPHKWLIVGGYQWSGTWTLGSNHGGPFITDAQNKVIYEAHQYFDDNGSGQYAQPELTPVNEENWVRWTPNVAMWTADRAETEGESIHDVEVFRVGRVTPVGAAKVWRTGISDAPVLPCTAEGGDCAHKTFEYRVVITDPRDGATNDFATSISGLYR